MSQGPSFINPKGVSMMGGHNYKKTKQKLGANANLIWQPLTMRPLKKLSFLRKHVKNIQINLKWGYLCFYALNGQKKHGVNGPPPKKKLLRRILPQYY